MQKLRVEDMLIWPRMYNNYHHHGMERYTFRFTGSLSDNTQKFDLADHKDRFWFWIYYILSLGFG